MNFCSAINLAIKSAMREDPSVFCYGIGAPDHKEIFGTTAGLVSEFGGDRCLDTPISEDSLAGFGLGASLAGLKPVNIHIRVDFLLLAINQIANAISSYRYGANGTVDVPITFRAVVGRGWGQGYQHSKSLHSYFAHLPGLEVYIPTTIHDAYSYTKAAILSPNPSVVLEHRWLYWQEADVTETELNGTCDIASELGESSSLPQVVVITTSWMGVEAALAKAFLADRGIEIIVISYGILHKDLPEWVFDKINRVGKVVVADNDWQEFGASGEIASKISERCFANLKRPVKRLGWRFVPCPTARHLENEMYRDANDVLTAVYDLLEETNRAFISDDRINSHENRFKGPF